MRTEACPPLTFNNPNNNCPPNYGLDLDFAQAPMLWSITNGTQTIDVVGAGQKSGFFITLARDTGKVVWSTYIGPGGLCGGMLWGSAVDATKIYLALSNCDQQKYHLLNGTEVAVGSWVALDRNTGKMLWQTADPQIQSDRPRPEGPVTITAGGVVFASSEAGEFHAFDATNGAILWTFTPGGAVKSAPVVSNGRVYWGSSGGHMFAFQAEPSFSARLTPYICIIILCFTSLVLNTSLL